MSGFQPWFNQFLATAHSNFESKRRFLIIQVKSGSRTFQSCRFGPVVSIWMVCQFLAIVVKSNYFINKKFPPKT